MSKLGGQHIDTNLFPSTNNKRQKRSLMGQFNLLHLQLRSQHSTCKHMYNNRSLLSKLLLLKLLTGQHR